MLQIQNLTLQTVLERKYPLWDLSLIIPSDQALAVVGESGGGKSSLAWATLGFPRPGQRVIKGQVLWQQENMLSLTAEQRRQLYFRQISLLPQEAMQCFHPTRRLRTALEELCPSEKRARLLERAADLTAALHLPAQVWDKYPHQLSGGQKQRLALVLALLHRPHLVILDEPTSALDVLGQHQVEELLLRTRREWGLSLLLCTHDLEMAARLTDRMAVLYAGQIVEFLSSSSLAAAAHPYTRALLAALPRPGSPGRNYTGIPGQARVLQAPPTACSFAPRCPRATSRCQTENPPLRPFKAGQVRCFYPCT
ncbi:MAG: oligopeptide/dipeptide ABC transporter ATP-binding protein [Desulfurispora sp.]|uniref:oligopeptide/dipeptide ABC transporter ATP-binding protein n=1 Tax=Desulfurispora sp. TaxID=3014275 RepID=UPI00404AA8AE